MVDIGLGILVAAVVLVPVFISGAALVQWLYKQK